MNILFLVLQASYEMLYSQYLEGEDNTGDQSTVEVMQAILNVNNTKKSCQIMWNLIHLWLEFQKINKLLIVSINIKQKCRVL